MSAPIQNEATGRDRDAASMYAPPWARDALLKDPELPARRRGPAAFEGDIALCELRARSPLDPDAVPEPPVVGSRRSTIARVARLSGASGLRIIFTELMPNLLPYLAASLVGAVAAAVLASLGLEALGLGAVDAPTIGMTIYWVIFYGALLQGMWWWFLPPIAIVVVLFMGLFSLSAGLDELANPRLRQNI